MFVIGSLALVSALVIWFFWGLRSLRGDEAVEISLEEIAG